MIRVRTVLRLVSRTKPIKHLRTLHRKAFDDKYLLLTNIGLSLGLSTTGDLIEQQYERYTGEMQSWNSKRTLIMAISGINVGIVCHHWYKFLDARMPGRTITLVMKKIVLDQLICSPIYISIFFLTTGILEHTPPAEIWVEMKKKAWKLYVAEWMVWPAAQFVNFYWLPTKYRVFYDNLISLGYDVYTSHLKHHD